MKTRGIKLRIIGEKGKGQYGLEVGRLSVKQLRKYRRFESFYCQERRQRIRESGEEETRFKSGTANENFKGASDIIDSKWNISGFTSTSEYKLCVRVWEYVRANVSITVSDRDIFSNALYSTCGHGV